MFFVFRGTDEGAVGKICRYVSIFCSRSRFRGAVIVLCVDFSACVPACQAVFTVFCKHDLLVVSVSRVKDYFLVSTITFSHLRVTRVRLLLDRSSDIRPPSFDIDTFFSQARALCLHEYITCA
jgi:hypothetical protein